MEIEFETNREYSLDEIYKIAGPRVRLNDFEAHAPGTTTPNATILAHLKDLRETLERGDVESALTWLQSAIRLLEKE